MEHHIRRIACIGEVMIELVAAADGSAQLGVAGDTYNTAVYLVRALRGTEATVAYVTALGDDPYSARIRAALGAHGLDQRLIETRPGAMPGLYAIDTDDQGERSFSYWRSASAARTLFSAPGTIGLEDLGGFDLVYLSGISVAILPPEVRERLLDWIDGYRAAGGRLAYDSNHRPRLWEDAATARAVTEALWRRTDIALPSADDEMALFGDAAPEDVARRLAGWGVTMGALKRGAAGPLDLSGAGHSVAPGPPVRIVDTTAAGDSFNAGYLAALIRGEGQARALEAGHRLAGRVIGARGAILPEEPAPET